MLFRFDEVYKSYGADEVLSGVTFQINPKEKVGLVGRNGAGKTTIFRLLMKQEEADRGQIMQTNSLSIGLLAQQHRVIVGSTVLESALSVFTKLREIEKKMQKLEQAMTELLGEALDIALAEYSELQQNYELAGGFASSTRAESVLLGLGFEKKDFSLPVTNLSGGQQARLSLACLLLKEPDILLLDEPTNHLDIGAIEWLEEFLTSYNSAYVIISHDRFMLDRCTNRILELEAGRISNYPGNFSFYLSEREERRKAQQNAFEQQQELIERTEEFIRRNLAGQKTKQAKSRRKMLERLDRIESVKSEETASNFSVNPIARSGDIVLSTKDLTIGYENLSLASNINFTLRRGEVLAIIGGNGTGKTTMLRTLLTRQKTLSGEINWGSNISIGYYDQKLNDLNQNNQVIDELREIEPFAEEVKLRSFLGSFNFRSDDVFKKVGDLSGGEQGRLALAKLVYSRVNVLVLDEPTNHLDITSRESLENALDNFTGTALVVSHDRYFLDRLATKIVYLDGSNAEIFSGTYSEYCDLRRKREEEQRAQIIARQTRVVTKTIKPKTTKSVLREVSVIEEEIAELEEEIKEVSQSLATVEVACNPSRLAELQGEYQELTKKLELLYQEWETTMLSGKEC
ncbi:MAG: ABC-F family ATP-binding cassette domain-containing protein [Acidobacteria bacterium]|nr:ABC-F family ATP-binding cassette domain-containing protein [Acidobacteriota bacterium]